MNSKKTNFILFSVVAVILVLLFGMLKVEIYKYHHLPLVKTTELNDTKKYRLINDNMFHDEINSSKVNVKYNKLLDELDADYIIMLL